jgi:predicted DNA-binding transcriptional regulator AlpA
MSKHSQELNLSPAAISSGLFIVQTTRLLEPLVTAIMLDQIAGGRSDLAMQMPEIIGLSNSTFYARIRDGSIKPGVPVGPRIEPWPASEIQSFVEGCVAKRGTGVEQ